MKYKYITSIFIIIFVVSISAISIIVKDEEISELEGRKLQTLPMPNNIISESFNKNAYIYELLTGDMFQKWDKYFSDHIYGRNNIVNLYTLSQDVLNKKYINNVYLGENGYMFSPTHVKGVSTDYLKDRAEHFNRFAQKFIDKKVYLVNLPNKNMLYEKYMPITGYKAPENVYIKKMLSYIDKKSINIIDFSESMRNKENLYYKTDHHWNMNGAYIAYTDIINNIQNDFDEVGRVKEKSEFQIDKYSNYFVGTDGRKVGQIIKNGEDIEVFNIEDNEKYEVKMQDKNWKLFDYEQLEESKFNNDYSVYLGGDNPKITVENKDAMNELSVVMIGDSMDNPLIPLMANNFQKIYSYDLRSYREDIIKEIEKVNPDIIILIGLSGGILQETTDGDVFRW